jgi:arylsulfatase A-like enzyme
MPAETGSRLIFRLEQAVDWLQALLKQNRAPILGYFHFYPPHRPYNTRREFVDLFKDGWSPPPKPEHFFTKGHTQDELNHRRRLYDEYVSYADAEFGRLYDFMDRQGYLENSHLILTSDHGEMFERGILAHITPAMYEPVLRVPLIISRPGSTTRVDVHAPTSSVDLLPTLAVLGGVQVPEWTEGRILTPFSGALPDAGRHIFSVEAKENPILAPLNKASIALMKDEYKLIHYRGYEDLPDAYELYNVVADPEEMVDLYSKQTAVAEHMRHELKTRLDLENRPFK